MKLFIDWLVSQHKDELDDLEHSEINDSDEEIEKSIALERKGRSVDMQKFLKNTFGVKPEDAISKKKCVDLPIGCGKEVNIDKDFKDDISRKEYGISGLCQKCQDKIFG